MFFEAFLQFSGFQLHGLGERRCVVDASLHCAQPSPESTRISNRRSLRSLRWLEERLKIKKISVKARNNIRPQNSLSCSHPGSSSRSLRLFRCLRIQTLLSPPGNCPSNWCPWWSCRRPRSLCRRRQCLRCSWCCCSAGCSGFPKSDAIILSRRRVFSARIKKFIVSYVWKWI